MDQQLITNIDNATYTSSSKRMSFLYKKRSPRRNKWNNDDHQTGGGGSSSSVSIRPPPPRRYISKKPDPLAPKITAPCAVCGRKFWSWKALFGHMRCHPERQWRGINPPTAPPVPASPSPNHIRAVEDHDVASSLLLLANTPTDLSGSPFECWSCKKVFGSHQALGGHMASHTNIKGCCSNNKTRINYDEDDPLVRFVQEMNDGYVGHQCSICFRVFSSGQALGGHKRCHWEKGGHQESLALIAFTTAEKEVCGLDLNLPHPMDDNSSSNCSFSSPVSLDLRLGL